MNHQICLSERHFWLQCGKQTRGEAKTDDIDRRRLSHHAGDKWEEPGPQSRGRDGDMHGVESGRFVPCGCLHEARVRDDINIENEMNGGWLVEVGN